MYSPWKYIDGMELAEALIESWSRQSKAIDNLASLLNAELLETKPSPDGWTLAFHLCHLVETRVYWLRHTSSQPYAEFEDLYHQEGDEWIPNKDLEVIRANLKQSSEAIASWLASNLHRTDSAGPYDHPAIYLQHMVWHEGWHAGLIMLGLRLAGKEPPEEWEDPNIWGLWRNWG